MTRASRSGAVLGIFLLAVLVSALAGAGDALTASGSELEAARARRVLVAGGGSYTNVSAAGLARMLAKKTSPLINVHVPYEGEIAGTDLHIPFDAVQAHIDKLPADKGAKIVLYCRSGHMSAIAAETLVKIGYTNVWNLEGGMQAWKDAGYPLVWRRR